MKRVFFAFLAGALFAIGLAVSGMTQQSKVISFLDVTGAWDPTLAFVIAGAVCVHLISYRLITRRPSPLLTPRFELSTATAIDGRLLAGTAIFGLGWGLGGYCPGPGLVSLGSGLPTAFYFGGGMLAGVLIFEKLKSVSWDRRAPSSSSPESSA